MKAVLMTAAGNPEVLQIGEVPTPTVLQATDLLVRLQAAGVNPIDTKLRQRGTFYPDRMPAILGCDGAGIVEAVGAAVQKFQPGDAVYFCNGGIGGHPGNYAEWAIVNEAFAARKPTSISFVEAAAAPLVLITAWEALYDRANLQAGQTALIHAGAGGVGHVAIQLAKLQGATVCTTVSTPEKADFVRQLGADHVIFYKTADFVQETLEWTGGLGVDVTFDTVGRDLFGKSFAATQIYGDIVTILEPDPTTNWKVARTRNQRISFELMLTPMLQELVEEQKAQAKILEQCARLIDQGQLKIHVGQTFPLRDAAAAHRVLEAGGVTGKLVLVVE
ncbi:zinc-dependent alcohol dehydrogenase family protein [Kovacikia minuta CCNUW1]|uniref:zinc-dependent alcohol dehydrogenase family protein n=1 Tax=Kovacikia minuta TaxID=2931930 RepID=UPI001CCC2FB0|nr:zinc-dependent alcohol dehydrogenase family protein [Kovacikia minuta]UBF28565.1 zinc-dependent alcohol dehydrogenase family protein [Kovacikia minuta CCNUW1]